MIAVTLNYRLGPLGFACLPELMEEAGHTGNYGLYDQHTAIRWVKDNIAAFGGNPERITIMGQSAGAGSVQQHCLSPMSKGLFSAAVMSSGGGVSKLLNFGPAEKNYEFWKAVMRESGCDSLAAFRELSPEALFQAWQKVKAERKTMGCIPCMDGRLITGSGVELLSAGKQMDIPYLCGSNSEDVATPIISRMAHQWCAAQKKPSYAWFFNRRLPGDDCGAWHSADLWYWFGTLKNGWRPWEKEDYRLTEQMTDYLTNFVKTGNPNSDGLPAWLPSAKKQKKMMCFGQDETHMAKPNALRLLYTMLTNKAVGE